MPVESWLPASIRALGVERTLDVGQILFRQGSRAAGLYDVIRGRVHLARVDAAGRETIVYIATAGDTLAEGSLFSAIYHCDAIAPTKAIVRFYPKAAVLAEFQRNPKAAQTFMAILARQVMSVRTRLHLCNIRSARDRVRDYLAINSGADGRTVLLPGTVKDLAAYLGLTHEALYRTLARMTADGEIKRSGNRITLSVQNDSRDLASFNTAVRRAPGKAWVRRA